MVKILKANGRRNGIQLTVRLTRLPITRDKETLTAQELSEILAVPRLTLLRSAKRGQIPSFHIRSLVRFDAATIARWSLRGSVDVPRRTAMTLARSTLREAPGGES